MSVSAQERRPGLGLVHVGIGMLAGILIGYACFDDDASPSKVVAEVAPLGTSVVYVNAVLSFPTGTATAIPTARPTDAPTVAPGLNWCGTATPGATCEVPPLPTPTITPLPDCADMAALDSGDLCRWR